MNMYYNIYEIIKYKLIKLVLAFWIYNISYGIVHTRIYPPTNKKESL